VIDFQTQTSENTSSINVIRQNSFNQSIRKLSNPRPNGQNPVIGSIQNQPRAIQAQHKHQFLVKVKPYTNV
jgi:hypothetical protein